MILKLKGADSYILRNVVNSDLLSLLCTKKTTCMNKFSSGVIMRMIGFLSHRKSYKMMHSPIFFIQIFSPQILKFQYRLVISFAQIDLFIHVTVKTVGPKNFCLIYKMHPSKSKH